MNLDVSVIRISAYIIKQLKRYRILSIDKIIDLLQKNVHEDSILLFEPSISFLYLINRIKYHQQTDSIEYIENYSHGNLMI